MADEEECGYENHDKKRRSKALDVSGIKPTLETISTWPWRQYNVYYNQCGAKLVTKRKRSSSDDEDNEKDKDDGSEPFHVVYHNRRGMPWAERVRITVHSGALLDTLYDFLPEANFHWLNVDKHSKVWVKDLFHIREKLQEKYAKLCSSDDVQEAAAASNNDHGSEGQLRFVLSNFFSFIMITHLSKMSS